MKRRRSPIIGLVPSAGALVLGVVILVALHALREVVQAAAPVAPPRPAWLPASWRLVDVDEALYVFLPPDLVEAPIYADEGGVRLWKSERMQVLLDFSGYGSQLDEREIMPPRRSLSRASITVSGQPALLRVTEAPAGSVRGSADAWTTVALHVPSVPGREGGGGTALTVFAHCKGAAPCVEGEQLMRAIALRWSPAARP